MFLWFSWSLIFPFPLPQSWISCQIWQLRKRGNICTQIQADYIACNSRWTILQRWRNRQRVRSIRVSFICVSYRSKYYRTRRSPSWPIRSLYLTGSLTPERSEEALTRVPLRLRRRVKMSRASKWWLQVLLCLLRPIFDPSGWIEEESEKNVAWPYELIWHDTLSISRIISSRNFLKFHINFANPSSPHVPYLRSSCYAM